MLKRKFSKYCDSHGSVPTTVFWNAMLCNVAEKCQRFTWTYCHFLQGRRGCCAWYRVILLYGRQNCHHSLELMY